eukprot:5997876-Pyramimonas_sp.AAC.1
MAVFTCVSAAQHTATWPPREHRRTPQLRCSRASPPPSIALRGTIESFTEGPGGDVRMRFVTP